MKNGLIKNSVKNFAVNAVYIFIPMGIIYLFLIVAIVTFTSALFSGVGGTIRELGALIRDSAEQSSVSVNEFISYTLTQLQDEGDIVEILKKLVNPQWVRATLEGFFGVLNQTSEGFEVQFTEIVNDFVSKVGACLTAAIWLCAAGMVLANFATGFAIRRRTARRDVKKFLIAHTIVPIVQSVIIVGAVFLLSVVKLYGLLLFAAILLIMSGVSLITAWLIHNDGSMKLKDVLSPANILSQLAVTLLALLFNVVTALLLLWLNPLLAVLIMLPVFIYTLNIADVNADSFICSQMENAGSF